MPSEETTGFVDDAVVERVLTEGELEIEGRLLSASNASFVGRVCLDGIELACIYKPVAGERLLWDFPEGTLAARECATRLVSEAGGWGLVPPTVMRDGRFGPGMVQRWVEVDSERALVDVVGPEETPPGWIAVVEAGDNRGQPVLLVHADDPRLREMAVLDVVINNADRKGGHVLLSAADDDADVEAGGGTLWGCDHGVTFHVEPKLRTVLWGWADADLRALDVERLDGLSRALDAGLDVTLADLLTRRELRALRRRIDLLAVRARMPVPDGTWPVIPWPAF